MVYFRVAKLCSYALVVSLGVACGGSGSDDPSNENGAGGTTTTSTSKGGSGTTSSTSSPESTDYSHCGTRKPNSTCTQGATCLATECGTNLSQLDVDSCLRSECTSDTDCASSELCFPGPVMVWKPKLTLFNPTCAGTGRNCECQSKTVTDGARAYCLPKAMALSGQGCAIDAGLYADCQVLSDWIGGAESLLSSVVLSYSLPTLAKSCIDTARERYDSQCRE